MGPRRFALRPVWIVNRCLPVGNNVLAMAAGISEGNHADDGVADVGYNSCRYFFGYLSAIALGLERFGLRARVALVDQGGGFVLLWALVPHRLVNIHGGTGYLPSSKESMFQYA
jgi:hypothetical protein